MTSAHNPPSLTECIQRVRPVVLESLPSPDVLFLSATGVGLLPEQLSERITLELEELEQLPEDWSTSSLHAGRLGSLAVWMIDDENPRLTDCGTWVGGFPVWLAAASGAKCCLHSSAGLSLPGFPSGPRLVLAEDHLRFGDCNPLEALGQTPLGPLFPDLTCLHDQELRNSALIRAKQLGIDLQATLVACTRGPALETRAERQMLASLGAGVCVQSLSAPLLAAGHAGLRVLSIVAIIDDGERPANLARQLQKATALAPQIEDLIMALVPDLETRVASLQEE